MRFLLAILLVVPAFAAEFTLTNGAEGSSSSVTPLVSLPHGADVFNQEWTSGPSSKGSCEYITISGVDSCHADDFELTGGITLDGVFAYFGPYYGAYTPPDSIDWFIDSDGDPGPATPYGYPWTPDTWTENWPYNAADETLWDAGNYIYTYEVDFASPIAIPDATVYYWAQQYEHDRSGGDQIGTPYDVMGSSYGDESYFASDYFGYGWTTWGTLVGGGPQRFGFILYGDAVAVEGASLGEIKATFSN